MRKPILSVLFILLFISCTENKKQGSTPQYFDLQGYFEKEENRLERLKPTVQKTVSINGSTESKSLKIADWKKELSIFTDADINKKAWFGQFTVNRKPELERYNTQQEKIPVKELKVTKKQGKVSAIQIILMNENALYTSADTLAYYPDSLYEVKKMQHIKLLQEKRYKVSMLF